MRQFTDVLNEVFPQVTALEQQILEQKYQRPGDPQSFDLYAFQNEFHAVVRKSGADGEPLASLDEATKRSFDSLRQFLDEGNV